MPSGYRQYLLERACTRQEPVQIAYGAVRCGGTSDDEPGEPAAEEFGGESIFALEGSKRARGAASTRASTSRPKLSGASTSWSVAASSLSCQAYPTLSGRRSLNRATATTIGRPSPSPARSHSWRAYPSSSRGSTGRSSDRETYRRAAPSEPLRGRWSGSALESARGCARGVPSQPPSTPSVFEILRPVGVPTQAVLR